MRDLQKDLKKTTLSKNNADTAGPRKNPPRKSSSAKNKDSHIKTAVNQNVTKIVDSDDENSSVDIDVTNSNTIGSTIKISDLENGAGPSTDTTSDNKVHSTEIVDDLNEEAAYIMEFDASEKNDEHEESRNTNAKSIKQAASPKRKPSTTKKTRNKKTPLPAPITTTLEIQKSSPKSDDDFVSPVLPLASTEPESQLPIPEQEDLVSLVKPIQPRRRIRKLTKVI